MRIELKLATKLAVEVTISIVNRHGKSNYRAPSVFVRRKNTVETAFYQQQLMWQAQCSGASLQVFFFRGCRKTIPLYGSYMFLLLNNSNQITQ